MPLLLALLICVFTLVLVWLVKDNWYVGLLGAPLLLSCYYALLLCYGGEFGKSLCRVFRLHNSDDQRRAIEELVSKLPTCIKDRFRYTIDMRLGWTIIFVLSLLGSVCLAWFFGKPKEVDGAQDNTITGEQVAPVIVGPGANVGQINVTNKVATDEGESLLKDRDAWRDMAQKLMEFLLRQQDKDKQVELTNEEQWRQAREDVARSEGITPEELQKRLDLFADQVKADPDASGYDIALAEFTEKNYLQAAETAGQAAEQIKTKRLAREQAIATMNETVRKDRDEERKLRELEGNSFAAASRYQEAVKAYEEALKITNKAELSEEWTNLTVRYADSMSQWAGTATGDNIFKLRTQALDAYRSALEVFTREHLPQQWARTQNNLAVALRNQASASSGEEQKRLLGEAVIAYRSALEVYTREHLPQNWATIQNNLGNALCGQASASNGEEQKRLLGEAVIAYRSALEVFTREHLPQDWAMTQNNLGLALCDQASASSGEEYKRLLGGAVTAYRAALEVYTREHMLQGWAMTQNNLGNALCDQASASSGEEYKRLLGGAVTAYRLALEVRTRAHLPQDWAMTQNNLGATLWNQASASSGEEQKRLLGEAVIAYRSALEVCTREHLPQQWAGTQNNLGNALCDQASASSGEEQKRLLGEAVIAYRSALEVCTREHLPQNWATIQNNLGNALGALLQFEQEQNPVDAEEVSRLKSEIQEIEASLKDN